MVPPSTTTKPTRPTPFTPRRPLSSASTPSLLLPPTTTKKYKAPLSLESRPATSTALKSLVSGHARSSPTPSSRPRTPTSRPRTPVSPRKEKEEVMASEMDVSNVDPESVLVHSQSVLMDDDVEDGGEGDVSVDVDDDDEGAEMGGGGGGGRDKVMVSIRVRPTKGPSAWIISPQTSTISLSPSHARSSSTTSSASSTSPNSTTPSTQSFTYTHLLSQPTNKPIYTHTSRSHIHAFMAGFNAVIFAYGQTASGKTHTLSGTPEDPGVVPRAMREVFSIISKSSGREYLLRCSYLEIYNETIIDLLAPPSLASSNPVQIQGAGGEVVLTPLREEVVTSLKGVRDVLKRGEGNRRTACTDWNERSSRSHSVFRVVVESRERGVDDASLSSSSDGRQTPGFGGRQTPGGSRLQARGGRSVRTSVLSLIDLAGSEKATSDKERTREGKYINTSLLTLGSVIATLADNASKKKSDHVPYRNSKLTRILQPSLSGNARISVICTINPDPGAVGESMNTLLFARRIMGVKLHAQKKEIEDTDALIERYRKEIEDLKKRLAEREAEAPVRNRRLSAREQVDESKTIKDLNGRIHQLTKLILTSATVVAEGEGEGEDGEERPVSPVKIDFDMSPYQLQQELLSARLQLETQAIQILSLEAALLSRPALPPSATESEKDKLIAEQGKTIRELEIVVRGYEENLGEPLRAVREDVEAEWRGKVEDERRRCEEKERWAEEVVRQLEREKRARVKLEDERRALAAFVSKFDALGLASAASPDVAPSVKTKLPMPTPGGAAAAFAERKLHRREREREPSHSTTNAVAQPSLLEQVMPEEEWATDGETSFDMDMELARLGSATPTTPTMTTTPTTTTGMKKPFAAAAANKKAGVLNSPAREILGDKENVDPAVGMVRV